MCLHFRVGPGDWAKDKLRDASGNVLLEPCGDRRSASDGDVARRIQAAAEPGEALCGLLDDWFIHVAKPEWEAGAIMVRVDAATGFRCRGANLR